MVFGVCSKLRFPSSYMGQEMRYYNSEQAALDAETVVGKYSNVFDTIEEAESNFTDHLHVILYRGNDNKIHAFGIVPRKAAANE